MEKKDKQERRRYTQEFKLEAIRLVKTGIAKARVARDLGIHLSVLKAWLRQFDHDPDNPFPGKGKMRPEEAELFRLKRELMKVTAERDILKKTARVLRERAPVKYAFMTRHRRVWPIRWMSQALGVSTSGFYEWLTRPESNRSMTNRTILLRIRESFEASHQTYGSPRVWRDLRDWNVPCSENRTARLMRQAGLVARVRLKIPRYVAGRRSLTAPNVLDRQFQADAPNQKWVADFTYIPTREGWLYLAVVLDLYSRMVVGWSMQKHMSTELVSDAMTMALWRRRPTAVLQHSD